MSEDVLQSIRTVLVEVAKQRSTITYGELLDRLPLPVRSAAEGDLAPILRAISVAEDDAGRALLTAVVVRENDGLPGAGWFRLAAERGRDVSDRGVAWAAEVARVHRAWTAA